MKTAISIPDSLFEEAEETAKRLGMSRSELYAKAVKTFLAALRKENITQQLNEVYAEEPSELDDVIARMQWASIPEEQW
jgi:metal-responsive CopG/Arc/MetJ family transcriptional regulator